MQSVKYVIKENLDNVYRIFCIAKYEILSENRDSKLGMIWTILDPLIQILSYWFAFGLGIRGGQPVEGVPYLNWMLGGLIVWFFLSAAIRKGTNSIHSKSSVITKMKFPVSILPTTVILKELFYHLITIALVYIVIIINGTKANINNLFIIYYLFCAVVFSISLTMVTSVLNMFTRDVKKLVNASMRLLMFVTPILWNMNKLPENMQLIMKCNPIYYIVEGYRDSLFYYGGLSNKVGETLVFWIIVSILFIVGSSLMYKFKHKFIDLI